MDIAARRDLQRTAARAVGTANNMVWVYGRCEGVLAGIMVAWLLWWDCGAVGLYGTMLRGTITAGLSKIFEREKFLHTF